MSSSYLFSSESVSDGHPDKVADQISDAVLDAVLQQDQDARVAAETLCASNRVVLAGEIATTAQVDYVALARDVVCQIGYDSDEVGLDGARCDVLDAYTCQSKDIAVGVDEGSGLDLEQGAGDQGLVFGYACDETASLMPYPIDLSHRLMRRYARVRRAEGAAWMRPDAKTQVSIRYRDHHPVCVETVVLSAQHIPGLLHADVREGIIEEVIKPVLTQENIEGPRGYWINPTGRFVVGGPAGDCGLTGRKIIVDTYGGMAPHGGGAFSGKDPSKIDRSGAYFARYLAKNVVAAGLARRCLIQISYAIGVARPVSLLVDTFGTAEVEDEQIEAFFRKEIDFRPKSIIACLDLLRPLYRRTATFGHFGRDQAHFPWERLDLVEKFQQI